MIPAGVLVKLARLSLSDEQAEAVADMLRSVEDATRAEVVSELPQRTARQDRNARYYEKKASEKRLKASYLDVSDAIKTDQDASDGPRASGITAPMQALIPVGLSIDNPPNNSPQESPPERKPLAVARSSRSDAAELLMEFEGEFWRAWPNKTAKPTALKAFLAARKAGYGLAEILAGVQRYVRDKPPDRPWLHPSTFLNQRRWEDQPAPVQTGPPRGDRHGGIAALMRETMDAMRLDDERRDAKQIAQASGDFGDVLGLPLLPPGGGRG